MLTLTGNVKEDTIVLTDTALKAFDGQTITLVMEESSDTALKTRLDQLRTQNVSSWGEDAQAYLSKLRSLCAKGANVNNFLLCKRSEATYTAPIIYFLENNPMYALKVQNFVLSNAIQKVPFTTSVITDVEYLPKPLQENKTDLVLAYSEFKKLLNMEVVPVIPEIASVAVKLWVKYPGIKPLDSIHLASAICAECDAFLTNDSQLKQVTEVKIIYLEDL